MILQFTILLSIGNVITNLAVEDSEQLSNIGSQGNRQDEGM
jgi:hypothetical protein